MAGRIASVALLPLVLGLSACGGGDRPLPMIRYAAVSPAGELLGAPTGDEGAYRDAMLGWFNRADSNGDGRLDLAEMMADADRTFALYDQNKDGAVTSSELTAYRVASPHHTPPVQGGEKMRPGRLNMTAAEAETASRDSRGRPQYRMGVDPVMSADANADFRVTLAEFRVEMTRRHAQMDRNGDGAVSRDEFLAYAEGPMRAWRQE
ncbi:EF-hand domain-containing protein [Niveispirillum irakense]|uniref:EF-hand domain-containing protein n=1 Tax=Niveispirillum irakense TaxID=34011 RepID=UPI0004074027|nr:EF-hand domain-containing protein [Niveispirillum irakense]